MWTGLSAHCRWEALKESRDGISDSSPEELRNVLTNTAGTDSSYTLYNEVRWVQLIFAVNKLDNGEISRSHGGEYEVDILWDAAPWRWRQ
jgi:hypothetical protein